MSWLLGRHGALGLALSGHLDAARQWVFDAVELAHSMSHAPSVSQARTFELFVEHLAGNDRAVLELSEARSEPVAAVWGALAEGFASSARGVVDGAASGSEFDRLLETQTEMADHLFGHVVATLAAQQWLREGEVERAVQALATGRRFLADPDAHFLAAETNRVGAHVAYAAGRVNEARSLLARGSAGHTPGSKAGGHFHRRGSAPRSA